MDLKNIIQYQVRNSLEALLDYFNLITLQIIVQSLFNFNLTWRNFKILKEVTF